MNLYEKFTSRHRQIKLDSIQKHKNEIAICQKGIGLFLWAERLLAGTPLIYSTPEEAVRTITWRYLISTPSTAYCCLQAAIQGQYRISLSILRILIEESVSIKYFVANGHEAKKCLQNSVEKNSLEEPKMATKLSFLKLKGEHSLGELYDKISELASHANALKITAALSAIENGERRSNEPNFSDENVFFITTTILRLLLVSLSGSIEAFHILKEDSRFFNQFRLFIIESSRIINQET